MCKQRWYNRFLSGELKIERKREDFNFAVGYHGLEIYDCSNPEQSLNEDNEYSNEEHTDDYDNFNNEYSNEEHTDDDGEYSFDENDYEAIANSFNNNTKKLFEGQLQIPQVNQRNAYNHAVKQITERLKLCNTQEKLLQFFQMIAVLESAHDECLRAHFSNLQTSASSHGRFNDPARINGRRGDT
eukprot:Pgem_evm2s4289